MAVRLTTTRRPLTKPKTSGKKRPATKSSTRRTTASKATEAKASKAAAKAEALKQLSTNGMLSDTEASAAYQAALTQSSGPAVLQALLRLDGRVPPRFEPHLQGAIGRLQLLTGDAREGVKRLFVASMGLSGEPRTRVQLLMAQGYRDLRSFEQGAHAAKQAIGSIDALIQHSGTNARLEDLRLGALFTLAVHQKNLGNLPEATQNMAVVYNADPSNVAHAIAYSGYLAMSGQAAESGKVHAAIPVPKTGTIEAFDYATNTAWLKAVAGDNEGFFLWGDKTVEEAKAYGQPLVGSRRYFEIEADFDGLRSDPRFGALLKKLPG